jgi:hypothetical protein
MLYHRGGGVVKKRQKLLGKLRVAKMEAYFSLGLKFKNGRKIGITSEKAETN